MHTRWSIPVLATLLALVLAGCSSERDLGTVNGSGVTASETREASGFDQVELRGIGQVTITQGAEEGVRIEAEDNLIPLITTDVSHDKLTIGWKKGIRVLKPTKPVKFSVTMRSVKQLHLTGLGEIQASGLQSENLDLVIDGSGKITLDRLQASALSARISGLGEIDNAGKVDRQNIRLNGSGQYQAQDLASQQTTINISGLGLTTVRVVQSLDVQIDGSGSVRYYGNPTVTQRIEGLGQVTRLGE